MKSKATVAVVVPLLNEAAAVPFLLEQLAELGADETVLVDGGSVDDTPALLAASPFLCVTSVSGRARQMNAGAKFCASDILLFIHVDTRLSSSHIDIIRKKMGESDIAGGRFDVRLSGQAMVLRLIERMINLRSRFTKIASGDQCLFVRRSLFEQMGGFPEQPLMEDIEFSKRLKRVGRIACLREKVETSSRRWEQHGLLATIWLMWKLRLLYWLGESPDKLVRLYRDAR